jgi:MerR family transcriptional regulator, thiopeptide resistance regulator
VLDLGRCSHVGVGVSTIGRLARRYRLSRSTLLYYDAIGLLVPSGRSASNYRLYTGDDERRLAAICTYRDMGLTLAEIREIVESGGDDTTTQVLERRLEELNRAIAVHREQQRVVLALLKNRHRFAGTRVLDKRRWIEILEATGLDEEEMHHWHVEFERLSPEAHQDFLESLGIEPAEVRAIRASSRTQGR